MNLITLTIFLFLMPFQIFADSKKDCHIKVKYFHKTGATDSKTYDLFAKSKSDCEKKSNLYKLNTTPNLLNKKEVTLNWTGK